MERLPSPLPLPAVNTHGAAVQLLLLSAVYWDRHIHRRTTHVSAAAPDSSVKEDAAVGVIERQGRLWTNGSVKASSSADE